MELAESIAALPFPVYGVVGNPLSPKLHSYGGYKYSMDMMMCSGKRHNG